MKHTKLLLKSTIVAVLILGVAASTPSAFAPAAVVIADSSGQHDDLDAG